MFIVENHLGDLELEKKETDGLRLYKLPSNDWVPSITSVTSFYNREVFREWRKRVGNEEADRVTKRQLDVVRTFMKLHKPILRTKS